MPTTPAVRLPLVLKAFVALGVIGTIAVAVLTTWIVLTQRRSATSMMMVLEADVHDAIARQAQQRAESLRHDALEAGAVVAAVAARGDRELVVELADDASTQSFVAALQRAPRPDLTLVEQVDRRATFRLDEGWTELWRRDALGATRRSLEARAADLDGSVAVGEDGSTFYVTVEPDGRSADELTHLLTRSARLELLLVREDAVVVDGMLPEGVVRKVDSFRTARGDVVTDDHLELPRELVPQLRSLIAADVKLGPVWGDRARMRTYVVEAGPVITNADIANVQVAMGSPEAPWPYVTIELTSQGRQRFGDVTARSVGRRLAVVLEDEVISAPVISERIDGGMAQITMGGSRTREEELRDALAVAQTLKAGALPVSVRVLRIEGPRS